MFSLHSSGHRKKHMMCSFALGCGVHTIVPLRLNPSYQPAYKRPKDLTTSSHDFGPHTTAYDGWFPRQGSTYLLRLSTNFHFSETPWPPPFLTRLVSMSVWSMLNLTCFRDFLLSTLVFKQCTTVSKCKEIFNVLLKKNLKKWKFLSGKIGTSVCPG